LKEGSHKVLSYYGHIVADALCQLFPNIGLNKLKLPSRTPWEFTHNRRKFFENYAAERGFDPLLAENWYLQSGEQILQTKGARRVISYHKGSLAKTLIDLFPGIGLDKSRFSSKRWGDSVNRRKFFENYARENGFDPLEPENWYAQPTSKILAVKGALRVRKYHKNSLAQALVDLFPNIGLNKSKLRKSPWDDVNNRRKFFEIFAKSQGFDPLIPENWHKQDLKKIFATKGTRGVIWYHKGSLAQALLDLFPTIGLAPTKIRTKGRWSDLADRRKVFETYAQEKGFDPLHAENWYKLTTKMIKSHQGGRSLLRYYGTLEKALFGIFPNIGLIPSKFKIQKAKPS